MLFTQLHIGTTDVEKLSMLEELGYSSMDELIEKTIPNSRFQALGPWGIDS